MSLSAFCDACKVHVEWHVTGAGRSMPIEPDPHPEGTFYFGPGLKLMFGPAGTRKRMYRCHWDVCTKGTEASKRALPVRSSRSNQCEKWDCQRDPDDGHRHCFRCGDTDHFADDCADGDA